jgi:hypothetical protein
MLIYNDRPKRLKRVWSCLAKWHKASGARTLRNLVGTGDASPRPHWRHLADSVALHHRRAFGRLKRDQLLAAFGRSWTLSFRPR